MNDNAENDPRLYAIPDIHGHAKGEHKAFTDERPIPLSARMLFLWFFHACRRGWPRFLMVTDHMNYLTFEDPAAINLVRRALKLAQAGDLYGAAETASVEVGHAAVVSEGLRRGMRYSIGAEVDNDPRSRPDAQNIVDAMKPDGMIRSVHFLTIDHPTHGPNWNWPFDNPEFSDVYEIVGTEKVWELYMATLLDAVERLPGNIVGHFYVPGLFGHWPDDETLERYEDQIVDACETRGMAIELNTRFLYRDHTDEEKAKYLAVHRRLLKKCKAKNVGIAVGSDAHSPKDQGRGFSTVLALLDECEINELVFPIAGRLARVALRVERKPEPAPAPEPVPTPAESDRKPVRKPRMSEAPARPKETTSKRDDAAGADDDAALPEADEAPSSKPKPRPKRSKNRAAAPSDEGEGDAPSADIVIAAAATTIVPIAPSDVSDAPEMPAGSDVLNVSDVPDVSGMPDVSDVPDVSGMPDVSDVPDDSGMPEVPGTPEVTEAFGMPEVTDAEPVRAEEAALAAGDDAAGDDLADEMADQGVGDVAAVLELASPQTSPRKARSKVAPVKAKVASGSRAKPATPKPKTPVKKAAKPALKPVAKKTPAKKAAAKKVPSVKAAPKKVTAKKAPVKKIAVRGATAKKSGVKKTAAKKTNAKKPAQKRR